MDDQFESWSGHTLCSVTDISKDDPCADGLEQFLYGINAAMRQNPAATI